MNTKKSLVTIVENMEILQEDKQGQLKGGFASVVSLTTILEPNSDNGKCKNKADCGGSSNDDCKNKTTCMF